MDFDETSSYFCSMLMSNIVDGDFKTYGCCNNHYIGVKMDGETYVKILPFSELLVIYPDGSA